MAPEYQCEKWLILPDFPLNIFFSNNNIPYTEPNIPYTALALLSLCYITVTSGPLAHEQNTYNLRRIEVVTYYSYMISHDSLLRQQNRFKVTQLYK